MLTKSKFSAFGKVKAGGQDRIDKEMKSLDLQKTEAHKKKNKEQIDYIDGKIREKLLKKQKENLHKEIQHI